MQAIGRIACDAERAKLSEDNRTRTRVPRIWKIVLPDIRKLPGAKKGLLPAFLAPSLASLTDRPPSGPKWVHEIKYDGYRMQARIDGPNVRVLTRKNLDWTGRFRSIATALEELRIGSALLDGRSWSRMETAFPVSTICRQT
jgi:bifunctional non-homologous end joining protein LigD